MKQITLDAERNVYVGARLFATCNRNSTWTRVSDQCSFFGIITMIENSFEVRVDRITENEVIVKELKLLKITNSRVVIGNREFLVSYDLNLSTRFTDSQTQEKMSAQSLTGLISECGYESEIKNSKFYYF